uniref:conjugative transfer relaxase/helicase TraI n=4 Tax=Escherichia coli TaxID=562 RepID=UPI0005A96C25
MLSFSVVKSAGSAGNYYTDKDNYYVLGSMGERWAGQGAEQLGLQGSVDKDVFTRLLEGRLPDGADLSRMQDGSNKHRPGYDLTFSAPKSVSMMAMLGGDKRLIDAHNQAVDFAVRQVEALASTRVMTDGQSETVLTGNLVMALFNHDTSRDQDPQLHTHVVVANVTQHNGEWKTLSSDKVGKTGFSENVLANRIAFGKIYQSELRQRVEALGYETEVVGKHGMWEMPGVPVEAFSSRSQAIREAVGEDASLKSRDVAALDTRKSKQHVDPEVRMAEWMQTLKETGFDIRAYRDAADQRAEIRTQAPGPASQDGPDVQQAVTQAIAGLSERKVQFTYTDVLARTVGILPPENGVIERARAGIDEAISREQLIPLDREKGLFTSGIHVLDELSVRALSRDIMKQNRVTVHPEKSVPRTAGYSDAVSVLAQDRPSLAIVSGQGGAAGQRERVAELVMMAREQGREVQIIAADRRSQMNLKQDERLSGELITGRRQLQEGMAFTPGSTVIVDQGEKLSLKETLTLLDGAARHNVQVLITDSGQRTGTGSALMAMKYAGVNTYRWQGGEQRPATIISEPDRNVRYDRLAGDFAASVKAGEESVAQVSGVREQAILTQAIRSELKTQGVLGHPEVTMTALSPVWLDSRSRYLRDMYRPGMVMEQWNPETRSHDRYVIDRVTAQSHSLTLRDAQGETQVVRISSLDSSWSLFRPEKMPVVDGERLRVTGKIPGLRVSGGDRLQVASVSEDAMTVVVPGRAEPATLPVADSPFTALKLENGWVETPGHSVSDSATVFASVTQMAMDNATLNGLARSGRDVRLYSSLDEPRTAEKLARQRSGETPDFSNTLFLLDESSMVGNTDMARAYALIAAGGGRAVASGDTDQLQAIAPGQPFRLQQTRSAADVAIMKEIVRQTPELREAVYSLINRDVERALSGLESVKPSQVPRQEGAWAPEHSVTEFSHSQEAKLAEAQQKAMLKGEAFPDIPMTLYEAIVRDYTGRTPEAREQTLIVTHLNEDRRVLNSMIHDAREKAGELGKEQVMVPVLNTANIRDGELRRLSTWENNPDALALVDSVYHRIAGISKDDGLI